MPLIDQIQKDIVTAMKARDEHRLSTLRMVKTALKNREIDKMAPLDDKESQQVLSTLIKQRKDSIEQFTCRRLRARKRLWRESARPLLR